MSKQRAGRPGAAESVECFVEGTRLTTWRGEVPVEEIEPGDILPTVSGLRAGYGRVRWVGWRQVDLQRHPQPEKVQPVRVRAGALGENQPVRDLLLSPDHALWLEGALIPVKLLIDGVGVVQESGWPRVTYFHVELEAHDAILAEGVPAESYLDTGNRGAFSNVAGVTMLHAEFGPMSDHAPERLAPRMARNGGPALRRVRMAIAERGGQMVPAARKRRAARS
ncbi:Hint domain-containing protein [Roseomonas sp. OT10]|uniref:Hint domain-containing protein n=1 Tax=Roseomonas cutis TaxID=2897332 RepID=UPI001E53F754|nr:Hint domain-containing protein [Roseomonas sp. OT10]UFN47300.1 Hint domain-containing protein [Roseomonas sp. OT10]